LEFRGYSTVPPDAEPAIIMMGSRRRYRGRSRSRSWAEISRRSSRVFLKRCIGDVLRSYIRLNRLMC
jgi:hypothetical protein